MPNGTIWDPAFPECIRPQAVHVDCTHRPGRCMSSKVSHDTPSIIGPAGTPMRSLSNPGRMWCHSDLLLIAIGRAGKPALLNRCNVWIESHQSRLNALVVHMIGSDMDIDCVLPYATNGVHSLMRTLCQALCAIMSSSIILWCVKSAGPAKSSVHALCHTDNLHWWLRPYAIVQVNAQRPSNHCDTVPTQQGIYYVIVHMHTRPKSSNQACCHTGLPDPAGPDMCYHIPLRCRVRRLSSYIHTWCACVQKLHRVWEQSDSIGYGTWGTSTPPTYRLCTTPNTTCPPSQKASLRRMSRSSSSLQQDCLKPCVSRRSGRPQLLSRRNIGTRALVMSWCAHL